MDNAAWFKHQLSHWRDNVAWTTERMLTEISLRENELYALWNDQAARDYRARYGMMKEEVQIEVIRSLRKIVTAMESLETAIADVTQHIQIVHAQLSEAHSNTNRVSDHIERAYKNIDDYELHSSHVGIKIEQALLEMERALHLLSFSETSDKPNRTDYEKSSSHIHQSQVGNSYSELYNAIDISESSGTGIVPLWNTERINELHSDSGFNGVPVESAQYTTPCFSSLCSLTSSCYNNAMNPESSIGSIMPSWAFRHGKELMLGFSTAAPSGALPFLGTSPAPASSYLSLRLGSDSKWHTSLGFGTVPASYDLKIGTSSLNLGGSCFEYAPPINVASLGLGLSTGGGLGISPMQAFGSVGMDIGNNTLGGGFGNTCCLSS